MSKVGTPKSEKEFIHEVNILKNNNNKKIYLLGGKDLEMKTIKEYLIKNKKDFIDNNLGRGAKIEDYSNELKDILSSGKEIIALELNGIQGTDLEQDIKLIDHHGKLSHLPATILQVLKLEGIEPSIYQKLVAANDSGYIPAMKELLTSMKINEKDQELMISDIRSKDREAQGITSEQEQQSEFAIKNKKEYIDIDLIIIHIPHNKSTIIVDKLFGSYKNLLIISEGGEINFYGDSKLCKILEEVFGGWSGSSSLGIKGSNTAFWGGHADSSRVEGYIKSQLKIIKMNNTKK